MSRFIKFAFLAVTVASLSACMSEGIDRDSDDGIFTITHTTKGTLYWE